MASQMNLNQAQVVSGLGEYEYTVTSIGSYTFGVKSTMLAGGNLRLRLQKNHITVLNIGGDSTCPTPTQTSMGMEMTATFAVNDVLGVIISSTSAQDTLPNSIKSTINLFNNEG